MKKIIENNAFGHFEYLPALAGFSVIEKNGLTLINCGLGSSMFNIVCDSGELPLTQLPEKTSEVIAHYQGQSFAWWMGPSTDFMRVKDHMLQAGFEIDTTEHAMICDLNVCDLAEFTSDMQFHQVTTSEGLEDFIQILEPYDSTARVFYEKLTLPMLQAQENLYVGYKNKEPVVIGLLFKQGNAAGIFSLLTDETKRGGGFGTGMMHYLMREAQKSGVEYVTLSASSDSGFRIYERLGFKSVGEFMCFEWKGAT